MAIDPSTALIFLPTTGALTGILAARIGERGGTILRALTTSAMLALAAFALTDAGMLPGLNEARNAIGADALPLIVAVVVGALAFLPMFKFLSHRSRKEAE